MFLTGFGWTLSNRDEYSFSWFARTSQGLREEFMKFSVKHISFQFLIEEI